MNSAPSPGDAIPRFFDLVKRELRRLATRQADQGRRLDELEARVEALENP